MENNTSDQISLHVSGNYPVRELDVDERNEPLTLVAIPCGFESLYVAVYGHGLSCDDCVDAAFEAMESGNPDWMNWNDIEAVSIKKDSAYIAN
tara:strand:+ start:69 stop:347 length:279 start_codon:yes stop_codon:yes gene_type:complete